MAPHSSSAVKLPPRGAAPPAMGAHRWSHAIAKGPPQKIRIVHVVEPTVIKTDARQFRELVQRLTGKPPEGVRGGGVGGEGQGASSSSSAESAPAESSSQSGGGSSSNRAAVATASAVKAEVKEEEEDMAASPEEEVLTRAFGEVLGGMKDGATAVKAAVKKEEEGAASPPEEGGFAGASGEADDTFDAFFQGLDDFLLSAFQADGFSL